MSLTQPQPGTSRPLGSENDEAPETVLISGALSMVAGASNAECSTYPATFWTDLR